MPSAKRRAKHSAQRVPEVSATLAAQKASSDPIIESGAARIGKSVQRGRFFPSGTPFLDFDGLRFVESFYNRRPYSKPNRADFDLLCDYTSFSSSLHLLEGWRYLSHAAFAIMNGARGKAIHLSYYGELRAALSILAGGGVNILKDKHLAVTDSYEVLWFTGATHTTANTALKAWGAIPKNSKRILSCLSAFGLNGLEWAEACGATPSAASIAEVWLTQWSKDLLDLEVDKELRNRASYRPDLQRNSMDPLSKKEAAFLRSVSEAVGPDGQGGLEPIDPAIVYKFCEDASESLFLSSGSQANSNPSGKMRLELFKSLTNKMGLSKEKSFEILQQISAMKGHAAVELLNLADPNNKSCIGVFSRALLLLRIASLLLRATWEDMRRIAPSGVVNWQPRLLAYYGENAHLWEPDKTIGDFTSIDLDRAAVLDDLNNWERTRRKFSGYQLWQECPTQILKVCQLERVGILALAS